MDSGTFHNTTGTRFVTATRRTPAFDAFLQTTLARLSSITSAIVEVGHANNNTLFCRIDYERDRSIVALEPVSVSGALS